MNLKVRYEIMLWKNFNWYFLSFLVNNFYKSSVASYYLSSRINISGFCWCFVILCSLSLGARGILIISMIISCFFGLVPFGNKLLLSWGLVILVASNHLFCLFLSTILVVVLCSLCPILSITSRVFLIIQPSMSSISIAYLPI